MMDLFNNMTDDQIALFGCVTALMVCGLVMSLSFYVGQFFNSRQAKRVSAPIRQQNRQQNIRTGKAA